MVRAHACGVGCLGIFGFSPSFSACHVPKTLSRQFYPPVSILFVEMISFDTVSSVFSIVGASSVIFYFRFLLPKNIVPSVWTRLRETEALLDNAEAVSAISSASEYRINFLMYVQKGVYNRSSSLTHFPVQPLPPILANAYIESSLPVVLPTTSTFGLGRPDLASLYPVFSNRGI